MKTTLKNRIFALVLTVLMLLPIFSMFIFADDFVLTNKPQNIITSADIKIEEGLSWNGWAPEYLIDGNATTGTYSPRGRGYAVSFNFEKAYYFVDFSVAINREGTLPDVTTPEHYSAKTEKIKIIAYKGAEVVYESAAVDATNLDTVLVQINAEADKIVISVPEFSERPGACTSIYEVEAYARTTPENCDAEIKNVAAEAQLSALRRLKNNKTGEYEIVTTVNGESLEWWATSFKNLVDGDIRTGTKSPKAPDYILQFDYIQERMISSVTFTSNGAGLVPNGANGGKVGIVLDEEGNEVLDENGNVQYQTQYSSYTLTIYAYDYNDDLIFTSDSVDVSSVEEITFNLGVNAAKVWCEVTNAGGPGYNGNILMWEVVINEGTGSHALETTAIKNPSCSVPGYIEKTCQAPGCGYVVKEVVEPTGFHSWLDKYELKEEASVEKNGIAIYTCKVCSTTVERDIPAVNHNWDNGTVVEQTCETEGYTIYKCTDKNCDLSYKADFKEPYGHNFDDGVIEKVATVTETGKLVYTCLRDGCGGTKTKTLRKARYTDNTFKIDNSIITKYEVELDFKGNNNEYTGMESDFADASFAGYLFDGITNEGISGTNGICNYWFAPGYAGDANKGIPRQSGRLYVYLDREYYFTAGTLYAAANWRHLEVHFEYKDGDNWVRTATYKHDRLNNMTVEGQNLTSNLAGGARASRIVIESVNGDANISYVSVPDKSPAAGGRLQFHELVLEAHKCDLTEKDYEPKANWNKATCTTDGSCKATCPVCNIEQTVVLDKDEYGHSFGSQNITTTPTCGTSGEATRTCGSCGYTKTEIVAPTGEHDFSKDTVFIQPTCDTPGIAQIVCTDCAKPSANIAIPATGIHVNDWIQKSVSNYTKEGETIHACIYCGTLSGEHENRLTEKLPVPEDFISFEGYELRMTDFVGVRAKFTYDKAILEELQKTCDITITVNVTDSEGETKSVVVYGKKGTQKYDEDTGEFAVVIKAPTCLDEYTFSYDVTLRNFRGTVSNNYTVDGGKKVSAYSVAKNILETQTGIPTAIKALYQEIVAEK